MKQMKGFSLDEKTIKELYELQRFLIKKELRIVTLSEIIRGLIHKEYEKTLGGNNEN